MYNVSSNHYFLTKETTITSLFSQLSNSESNVSNLLNLIASENVLSPMAKLPFLMDIHSRYFLDDIRRFGKWFFPTGAQVGQIEQEILIPLLSELTGARYVDARPISGMNCMMVAIAALTKPGDRILTIPVANGGHVSTAAIVKDFGLELIEIPFTHTFDIDFGKLEQILMKTRPALIYIDQANLLFPIDPSPIRDLIDAISPETIIHYDSSHTNGLIIGNALSNPIARGAHCFGGSTHKTLPGPHKGFIATNDQCIAVKIQNKADYLISHNHTSSMISLAITLMEMKWCNGTQYAKQVLANTKAFAHELAQHEFHVAANDRGYTNCHQVWAYPLLSKNRERFSDLLTQIGIITNMFDSLPGIQEPAFRFSLAEVTRMGATIDDAKMIAKVISNAQTRSESKTILKKRIRKIKEKLSKPNYCFELNDVNKKFISTNFNYLCESIFLYNKFIEH